MNNKETITIELRESILFMNSRKSESNLHDFCAKNQRKCMLYGLMQTEAYIDRSITRDIDRDIITKLLEVLNTKKYEVLIIRNVHELTYDETDLENILEILDSMNINVFELDTMKYHFSMIDKKNEFIWMNRGETEF